MPFDAIEAASGLLRRLDAAFIARAFPRCPNPAEWPAPLQTACGRYGIDTLPRLASFLAEAGHESGDLCRLRESLDYSPQGLLKTFPGRCPADKAWQLGRCAAHPADQSGIAELVYGGRKDLGNLRKGDGALFIGRGIFQITGRFNYSAVATHFGRGVEDVAPWIETPEGAAWSAAHYWYSRGFSAFADRHDFDEISRRINGARTVEKTRGIDDRRARRKRLGVLLGELARA